MAEDVGRNFKLLTDTTVIAGIRTKSVSINNEIIDITTDDDSGWRTLLSTPGQKAVDISFDGVTTDTELRTAIMSTSTVELSGASIEYPNGDTLTGTFMLVNLEESGTYNDAVTFSGSLQSSGAVTYTAA